jgi:hypothetical protein
MPEGFGVAVRHGAPPEQLTPQSVPVGQHRRWRQLRIQPSRQRCPCETCRLQRQTGERLRIILHDAHHEDHRRREVSCENEGCDEGGRNRRSLSNRLLSGSSDRDVAQCRWLSGSRAQANWPSAWQSQRCRKRADFGATLVPGWCRNRLRSPSVCRTSRRV